MPTHRNGPVSSNVKRRRISVWCAPTKHWGSRAATSGSIASACAKGEGNVTYVHAAPLRAGSSAVVYTADDGSKVLREGGSRSWRNNNPGNIRYTQFARNQGAIGTAGGFAVFADVDSGRAALLSLLTGPTYISLTISAAISRYAPPNENDTANYERLIARLTGLDVTRVLSTLAVGELRQVASAIETIEGYVVGTESVVRRISAVRSDGDRLISFLMDGDSRFISLDAAIRLASAGVIDAVVVRPSSGRAYLRSRADGAQANNFSIIAERVDA